MARQHDSGQIDYGTTQQHNRHGTGPAAAYDNPYAQYDQKYGALFGVNNRVLSNIGHLESTNNPRAHNDWDVNARNGIPSHGRMQFIQPTFNSFLTDARKARPNVFKQWSSQDWKDPEAQTALTAWAIRNGKGSHWATFNDAQKGIGGPLFTAKNWNYGKGLDGEQTVLKGRQQITPGKFTGGDIEGGPNDKYLKNLSMIFRGSPRTAAILAKQHIGDNPMSISPMKFQGGTYKDTQTKLPGAWTMFTPTGNTAIDKLNSIKEYFGMANDSTAGWAYNPQMGSGSHASGSLHYDDKAIDWGDARNSRQQFNRLGQWAKSNAPSIQEFFYDPLGWHIKNGQVVQGAFGGHGDHAHLGLY